MYVKQYGITFAFVFSWSITDLLQCIFVLHWLKDIAFAIGYIFSVCVYKLFHLTVSWARFGRYLFRVRYGLKVSFMNAVYTELQWKRDTKQWTFCWLLSTLYTHLLKHWESQEMFYLLYISLITEWNTICECYLIESMDVYVKMTVPVIMFLMEEKLKHETVDIWLDNHRSCQLSESLSWCSFCSRSDHIPLKWLSLSISK